MFIDAQTPFICILNFSGLLLGKKDSYGKFTTVLKVGLLLRRPWKTMESTRSDVKLSCCAGALEAMKSIESDVKKMFFSLFTCQYMSMNDR